MEKQTASENKTATKSPFTRKKRIGFEPMSCDENKPTVFVELVSAKIETFESKNYPDGIQYVDVIDMETGLESRMWVGGQLKHNLTELLATTKTLAGLKLEINWIGHKKMEIDDETVKVNQYRLFELN